MGLSNPVDMVKTTAGVAVGTALIAPAAPIVVPVVMPVVMPVVHGLVGIAFFGATLFAVGSLVVNAAGALSNINNSMKHDR